MHKFGFWGWLIGAVLHYLIAGLLIFSGAMKLAGPTPAEVTEMLTKAGIIDDLQLIAYGEMAAGLVLILPWTASLGVLLVSSFWGGTIVFHMTQNDSYAFQSVLLLVTWIGAFLRMPEMFSSFSPSLAKKD
jgi:hypothetical protein